jgi:hypothetical protein
VCTTMKRLAIVNVKLDTLVVAMVLLKIRFAFSFLWFVVECDLKGHCHGQLDEQQLQFLLVVHKLVCFCLCTMISVLEFTSR